MPDTLMSGRHTATSLADYTSEQLIIPQLHARETAGVVQELSQVLHQEAHVPDLLPFYQAALNREFLVSTAMTHGMAFPHARLSGLAKLCFALGRTATPIPWGTKDAPAVQFVFLLAVPSTEATVYLHVVSGLARLGKDETAMAALQTANDPQEILSVLRSVKLPHVRTIGS
jgi:mannitol/fructose-specific phosphotransferase system IIA component (Ntr-type)